MIKLENYTFKKKATVGKYRTLVEHFLESKEPVIAWECTDNQELHRVSQGFLAVIRKRNLKHLIRVKQCARDLVVGLERVTDGSRETI